jgi:fructose-1,6-bisphosphatase I
VWIEKLRPVLLLYECNPFAFIIEIAGGKATDGKERILEKQPISIHEHTPFFCGSILMIKELEDYILPVQ